MATHYGAGSISFPWQFLAAVAEAAIWIAGLVVLSVFRLLIVWTLNCEKCLARAAPAACSHLHFVGIAAVGFSSPMIAMAASRLLTAHGGLAVLYGNS